MSVDPAELPRLFHGGVPGLRPGDLITPHPPRVVDGCHICQQRAAGIEPVVPGLGVVDPVTRHPDRVYVTSDRDYGRFYASRWYRGDLYVVEAVGDVEPSDEDRFPTWMCQAARVRSVYDRCVLLTMAQRRSLLRRWTAADIAAAQAARAARSS
jgi:hypothetical protein